MPWIAELSNGERVVEPEVEIQDELSPWHLLIERCRRENLRILQLHLSRAGVNLSAIPLAAGYAALYELRMGQRNRKPALAQGIASIVGDWVFINWIEETGRVSQEVRPFGAAAVHTTLAEKRDVI
jgi:hypothetical protein